MDLWINLLFGNWIGVLSLLTVFGSISIVAYIMTMAVRRGMKHDQK